MNYTPMQEAYLSAIAAEPLLRTDNAAAAQALSAILGRSVSPASVSSLKSNMKAANLLPDAVGVYASAVRMNGYGAYEPPEPEVEEDEDVVGARIERAYDAFHRQIDYAVRGRIPSLIGSGPPGLGKSFGVNEAIAALSDESLEREERLHDALELQRMLVEDGGGGDHISYADGAGIRLYRVIRGSITAAGLYMALWETKSKGVLVLDDCDDVFRDEEALNLLKAALESEETRRVSYQKRASWLEQEGIPMQFEYNGTVIFLTNLDFEAEIQRAKGQAKHFEALIDRSLYVSLGIKTKRDIMIRLRQVCSGSCGLLAKRGLDVGAINEIMDFVAEHAPKFYGLSIRLVKQIAQARERDPKRWREDMIVAKTRTRWS